MKHDDNYEDIINLPRHISKKHKAMPIKDRAAQFLPFAALTVHGEAIKETERYTEEKIELEEDEKIIINNTLLKIKNNISNSSNIKVEYFVKDMMKSGGHYTIKKGKVKNIDEYKKCIIMEDKEQIKIENIINIEEISLEEENE